ncbi:hypothetical protein GCM10023084_79740 [Streptomyces lacrimifluminis]|uniref:Integrase catalytic domain-containing protein n=2 Tax=Streptomyces lacrimifluminis TaxID=1500077 RepID=A0A917PB32_9ACTN|nr:hypothetical protein GCM10012282_77730 [Streptomyces lacrimifluminis]
MLVLPSPTHTALDNARRGVVQLADQGRVRLPPTFATRAEARLKIATWITGFYNSRRRHSAADGLPPEEFERIIIEARERHSQEDRAA